MLDRYLRSPVCKQAERNNENDNMQLLKMVKRDLPAGLWRVVSAFANAYSYVTIRSIVCVTGVVLLLVYVFVGFFNYSNFRDTVNLLWYTASRY